MRFIFAVIAGFVCCSTAVYAERLDLNMNYVLKSGDKELDLNLADINKDGRESMPDFLNDLSKFCALPREKIEELAVKEKMAPADVYMSANIANLSQKPLAEVVEQYKKIAAKAGA